MRLFIIIGTLAFGQSFAQTKIPNTLTPAEKVYGLSKFWQEVNYNFVYLSKIDRERWDELYRSYIEEVQDTKNDYEYYRILQRYCAFLKDGHTSVWMPDTIKQNLYYSFSHNVYYTEFLDIKLQLENIEGKAIIVGINKKKKDDIPIGSEIVAVNGLPVSDYIEESVKPYISTSAPHTLKDLCVQYLLNGIKGSNFDIEIRKPNGQSKKVKLIAGHSEDQQMYPPIEKKDLLTFRWEDRSIAYLGFNSFSSWDIMDKFAEIKPQLDKAEKLIIDLRYNTGGNSAVSRELIKYLTADSILYMAKSQSRLHIPTYKAWGKWRTASDTLRPGASQQHYLAYHDRLYHDFPYQPYNTGNLDIERIEIPTVILIGHNTASAAEDFLIYAHNQEHMTKIGEPTNGSTGQPLFFELPGGGTARICTKKDTYPDGSEFVGYGIKPDILVKSSLNDFVNGNDPVLKRAIEYLNEN